MTSKKFAIRVPASTANLGPGFDVLGMSLSLFLTLSVEISSALDQSASCDIRLTYSGEGSEEVRLEPSENLITKTAQFVASECGKKLPSMTIHCDNQIPFGSGLGSSGAAVVAGVVLANEACELQLDKNRLLDYCLEIEGHPDNVSPSLLGGFVAAYMRESSVQDTTTSHASVGHYIQLPLAPSIKAVAVTPKFQLPTVLARQVLPASYTRPDIIFNLQRLAVLVAALGQQPPDPTLIYEAMQDKIHQQYRQHLIPGLPSILSLTPKELPGLLGVAMSGAGPTVLALATDHFDSIGKKIQSIFAAHQNEKGSPMESTIRILDIDFCGTRVIISNGESDP